MQALPGTPPSLPQKTVEGHEED
jgi:hypothetical protein